MSGIQHSTGASTGSERDAEVDVTDPPAQAGSQEAPYRVVLVGSGIGTGLWAVGYLALGLPFPFLGMLPLLGSELAPRLYSRSWVGDLAPSPNASVWRRLVLHLLDSGWLAGMTTVTALYLVGASQTALLLSAAAAAIAATLIVTATDTSRPSRC